ncbi:MAG: glutamine hydrolyzing CTP synthase, partial [Candidatus Woesearchaeota archaeon]
ICDYYIDIAKKHTADVVLIEVGGTIGDIENELYVEATRRLAKKVGSDNSMFVHMTYVPIPNGVDEQKTKPTQQSVSLLKQKGIFPDVIIARCSEMLSDSVKGKIARFCDVDESAIITGLDVDNIYKIPIVFEDQHMSDLISKKLKIPVRPEIETWTKLVEAKKETPITVAIAGKYTALEDSYASVIEALKHAAAHHNADISVSWVDTRSTENFENLTADAVIVPGGFGTGGTEGKIKVIEHCRTNNIPFLGICYGLQLAVIEYARNVCGILDAQSTEIVPDTKNPVVDILEEQKSIKDKGGTMRLGAYPAILQKGVIFNQYKKEEVSERHRHRYEVNPSYHSVLLDKGLVISGLSPSKTLAEFIELPQEKHAYFVATQSHPELQSSLLKPAPLFMGLVEAAVARKKNV